MGFLIGFLLNTILVAGLIVWLSKGGGANWINKLNSNSLSAFVVLIVIIETAGSVNGMFVWSVVNGKTKDLGETMGFLGIWFGFLTTLVTAIFATLIGKRVTDDAHVAAKGAAQAVVEAAKIVAATTGELPPDITGARPVRRPPSRQGGVDEPNESAP
jgi:hypothetical protein